MKMADLKPERIGKTIHATGPGEELEIVPDGS